MSIIDISGKDTYKIEGGGGEVTKSKNQSPYCHKQGKEKIRGKEKL